MEADLEPEFPMFPCQINQIYQINFFPVCTLLRSATAHQSQRRRGGLLRYSNVKQCGPSVLKQGTLALLSPFRRNPRTRGQLSLSVFVGPVPGSTASSSLAGAGAHRVQELSVRWAVGAVDGRPWFIVSDVHWSVQYAMTCTDGPERYEREEECIVH
ncbi:unnamed protein product [Lota lota]